MSATLAEAGGAQLAERVGVDATSVRVHEDGVAEDMGAQVVTKGQDIHFARGELQALDADFLVGHEGRATAGAPQKLDPFEQKRSGDGATKSGAPTTYTVQAGETLQAIAAKLHTTVDAIKAANAGKLKSFRTKSGGTVQGFNAGDVIGIPGSVAVPAPARPVSDATTAANEGGGGFVERLLGAMSDAFDDIRDLVTGSGGAQSAAVDEQPIGGTKGGTTAAGKRTGGTPAAGATAAGMPALSQVIWYGVEFQDLGVTEVLEVSKVLRDVFGIGSPGALVTEPDETVKKKNPNDGYWWFRADGTPAWNGDTGTQYVLNNISSTAGGSCASRDQDAAHAHRRGGRTGTDGSRPRARATPRRPLALEIGMANGRSTVRIDRGLELR